MAPSAAKYNAGDCPIARLQYEVQSYDWGKVGGESKVATLATSSDSFVLKPDTPYAELWMGTHPNGPSKVYATQKPLKDVLSASNLSWCYQAFDGDVPFLFKVLSIAKALSIQAHPDKALAKELHTKRPDLYKDPNHKPEMAVALTPFEAFIGFRPLPEIAHHLSIYPEFKSLVGTYVADSFTTAAASKSDVAGSRAALKELFAALMRSDPAQVSAQVAAVVARVGGKSAKKGSIDELVVRLNSQFPGDVGIFCAMMLNYLELQTGEAIYLAANEPHAYISGDCVECMAASDNVVRSGLTPKFKDVDTLINMLTYNNGPAESQILRGDPFRKHGKNTRLYDPPIEEFSVLQTSLAPGESEPYDEFDGPSILIVTEGSGSIEYRVEGMEGGSGKMDLQAGLVLFVGANVKITLSADTSSTTIYRAFYRFQYQCTEDSTESGDRPEKFKIPRSKNVAAQIPNVTKNAYAITRLEEIVRIVEEEKSSPHPHCLNVKAVQMPDYTQRGYIEAGLITIDLGSEPTGATDLEHWQEVTQEAIQSLKTGSNNEACRLLNHVSSLVRGKWAQFEYCRTGNNVHLKVWFRAQDEAHAESKRCEKAMKELIYPLLVSKKCDIPRSNEEPAPGILGIADIQDLSRSLQQVYSELKSPSLLPLASDGTLASHRKFYDAFAEDEMVSGIRTPPYAYQKRGISKMLRRELERGVIKHADILELPAVDGGSYYLQKSTGVVRKFLRAEEDSFEDVRGGVLCEDMGNGKTYMMLSLISSTRHQTAVPSSEDPTIKDRYYNPLKYDVTPFVAYHDKVPISHEEDEHDNERSGPLPLMALAAQAVLKHVPMSICKTRLPKAIWKRLEQCEVYFTRTVFASNRPMRSTRAVKEWRVHTSSATFVIVPETLIDQWISEFNKHVNDDVVRMLVIKDDDVIPNALILKRYHIILMGYSRFMKEDEKGGFDFLGIPRACRCPYIGSTRAVDCQCLAIFRNIYGSEELRYESPLVKVHALRLIIDEGHVVSEKHSRVVSMAKKLSVERKWICSGTPLPNMAVLNREREIVEKLDLEKLGGILDFLDLRPYCDVSRKGIKGCFRDVIMRPVLNKSTTAYALLESLLENIMIRSRTEDVERDVTLPPLYERVVSLRLTRLQAQTYNYYVAMAALNAVLSEREHQDYLLHPQNRRHRKVTVDNIIECSFWRPVTGVDGIVEDLNAAIENGQEGLSKGGKYSDDDRALLQKTVDLLIQAREDTQFVIQQNPSEVKYYIQGCSEEIKEKYPTFEVSGMDNVSLADGDVLEEMRKYYMDLDKKLLVSDDAKMDLDEPDIDDVPNLELQASPISSSSSSPTLSNIPLNFGASSSSSIMTYNSDVSDETRRLGAKITSTASSKLTYLANSILKYSSTDKILIYSNVHNEVAFLHQFCRLARIPCLLYHRRGMTVDERSKNIALFQTSDFVRVMLMDIRIGAYGIDLSTASRVYFTSPIWQPDVERQAIKRAHRIGCKKPVYIETLVASHSLEEEILSIRSGMSATKSTSKSVYDDGLRTKLLEIFKYIDYDKTDTVELFETPIPAFPKATPPRKMVVDEEGDMDVTGGGGSSSHSNDPLRDFAGVDLYDPNVPLLGFRAMWVNSHGNQSDDEDSEDGLDIVNGGGVGDSSGNVVLSQRDPKSIKPGQMYLVGGAHTDQEDRTKSPRKRPQTMIDGTITAHLPKRRRTTIPLKPRKKKAAGSPKKTAGGMDIVRRAFLDSSDKRKQQLEAEAQASQLQAEAENTVELEDTLDHHVDDGGKEVLESVDEVGGGKRVRFADELAPRLERRRVKFADEEELDV
ncbi:mannose-6-phosphate isomerase [Synchytrium microbalum]|uniref:Mannose-6-phosphate isomerase n=1 Tax=Synchytrium microbalum TaxID=1806994 RepID=A0A507BVS3_9FUNG|nr:mannose-6-phosphate isomerase [Synchytrium microbalum]TPX32967.1 mannose-6-phosphate isomerase [Synchytrium microbalum]